MARSWQYPRWRRLAMQGALWLVLGATLGLAALVARQRQTPLDEPRQYADLSVRLPAGWAVSAASEAQSPLIVQAKEPAAAGGGGRTLTVLRQRTRGLLPPLQYLLHSGWLKGREESYERQRVGGWPGVRIGGMYVQRLPGGEERPAKQLLACAVLPSHRAVTIMLEGSGPLTSADQRIVQQVAEAIRIRDEDAMPEPGGRVELPDGIGARVPDGFVALRSDDANRVERRLLVDNDAEGWGVIELVPCLVLSQKASEAGDEAARLLALRDPLWVQVKIEPAGSGRWTLHPVDEEAEVFPVRAHLLSDPSGQALLLICRAGLRGGRWFDRAWNELADSVRFPHPLNVEQALADGALQARRWREAGLARLVPPGEQDEWWLWYNERFDHYIGWSHLSYQVSPAAEFAGVRETRWRLRGSGDALLQTVHRWVSSNDLLNYAVEMDVHTAVAPAAAAPPTRFTWAATQRTTLAQGRLTTALTGAGGSGDGPTTTPATAPAAVAQTLSRAAPDNYVPGAWLPLLLGAARIDRPVLLQTEWLVGEEARSSSELLTLIVRPGDDDPTRATREAATAPTTDPAADGVRTLLVQVNGSGQISRWWFAPDGTVTKIDLADGMRRVRSEREGIRRNFESDPRMVP